MIRTSFEMLRTAEVAWAVVLLLLLAGARLYQFVRNRRRAAKPDIQPEVVDALSVYLGGNHDSDRLRALAKAHPEEVRETILQYQTIVAGRRDEICELAIALGYVQRWCDEMHSAKVVERRKALSCIAAVAHYEPVRRLVGHLPVSAFRDPDEQIRLEAARILISTGEPEEIIRVFEGVLSDTPFVRQTIGEELGRYATQLCEAAVPQALRSQNAREVLKMLVSWERILPLPDMQLIAEHPDPAVRVEVMRLLPFLPPTPENRSVIFLGQSDKDHDVSAAAAASACRMRLPDPHGMAAQESDAWPDFVHAEEGAGC